MIKSMICLALFLWSSLYTYGQSLSGFPSDQVPCRWYGTNGNKDDVTISAAISALGTRNTRLVFDGGLWWVSNNVVFPSNLTLEIRSDTYFSVATNKTIGFIGNNLIAEDRAVFAGSGMVTGWARFPFRYSAWGPTNLVLIGSGYQTNTAADALALSTASVEAIVMNHSTNTNLVATARLVNHADSSNRTMQVDMLAVQGVNGTFTNLAAAEASIETLNVSTLNVSGNTGNVFKGFSARVQNTTNLQAQYWLTLTFTNEEWDTAGVFDPGVGSDPGDGRMLSAFVPKTNNVWVLHYGALTAAGYGFGAGYDYWILVSKNSTLATDGNSGSIGYGASGSGGSRSFGVGQGSLVFIPEAPYTNRYYIRVWNYKAGTTVPVAHRWFSGYQITQ